MDITAENSFGGKRTDSYFAIYDKTTGKFSAISFDGIVTHRNDLADKNKMYAMILKIRDGGGQFITYQLDISRSTFADYLEALYHAYY